MKAYVCDWCGGVTPELKVYRFYEFYDDSDTPKIHIGRHRKKIYMCPRCYNLIKETIIKKSRSEGK